jgi:uncharacterized SAM-binding protein YcdF (DUF218 family)
MGQAVDSVQLTLVVWLIMLTIWTFLITAFVIAGYLTDWDERLGKRNPRK